MLPTHLLARVVSFLQAPALQQLRRVSRELRAQCGQRAVFLRCFARCENCDAQFCVAENTWDACRYHPCTVREVHSSQSSAQLGYYCCDTAYASDDRRWDEAAAQAVRDDPGCVVGPHYVASRRREFREGDQVEALATARRRWMSWRGDLRDLTSAERPQWVPGTVAEVTSVEGSTMRATRWLGPYERHNLQRDGYSQAPTTALPRARISVDTEAGRADWLRPSRVRWPSAVPAFGPAPAPPGPGEVVERVVKGALS